MDDPLRRLSPEEIRVYERDGVVAARGLFPDHWLARMAAAVDRITENPTPFGGVVSVPEAGFSGDLFIWKLDDDFRDWVYESPAAHIASQVLRGSRIRHFYDQLFIKPPGCHLATPWHHDITFWPVEVDCRNLCSIWITLDRVTRETSGLEFVRGSHRWPRRFKAVTPHYEPYLLESDFEDPPDIDAERGKHDLFCPDLEPGDCLIFNSHVLHGSSGNTSTDQPRRAFSTRWAGEGVRYEARHATMPLVWDHGLESGEEIGGSLFPQVLPEAIPEEGERRAQGPEPPDPAYVQRVLAGVTARSPAG